VPSPGGGLAAFYYAGLIVSTGGAYSSEQIRSAVFGPSDALFVARDYVELHPTDADPLAVLTPGEVVGAHPQAHPWLVSELTAAEASNRVDSPAFNLIYVYRGVGAGLGPNKSITQNYWMQIGDERVDWTVTINTRAQNGGPTIHSGIAQRVSSRLIPEPTALALAAMLTGCGMMGRRRN
jgi:hypothetical protein